MELTVEKRGLTNYQLKLIAIIAMTIDHCATAFIPYEHWLGIVMHFVGRITGPVMFYMAVEGYHRTSNLKRYIMRLGIFAVVSYFPFMLFRAYGNIGNINFFDLNVIYTICLGVMAIHVNKTVNNVLLKVGVISLLLALSSIGDWAVIGIVIMMGFDFYYGDFKNQSFYYLIIILMSSLINYLYIPFRIVYLGLDDFISNLPMYKSMLSEFGLFIPIILLKYYNGERGSSSPFSKWIFYIYYPLHLLVIGIISGLTLK
ncbi:TraX family protein [Anaerosphaera multitolerans]|uniref:Conjugal transfer protein TraX n=1 Tax=Anaerosphaera multitolerans TaxID=2487351 RepID=A0A437S5R9_9FIRM|nr:TraX family protein [Anaerosphaera multitolerans]RVU54373.1 hypothetical protein EF514_07970 [Anaerosphaera multitolerans]